MTALSRKNRQPRRNVPQIRWPCDEWAVSRLVPYLLALPLLGCPSTPPEPGRPDGAESFIDAGASPDAGTGPTCLKLSCGLTSHCVEATPGARCVCNLGYAGEPA